MLQKSESVKYNRLSRRQVLQILGVGMGALAIGGCTTKLGEVGIGLGQRNEFVPLSAVELFPRTYQARASLDKQYLNSKALQLIKTVKSLKEGQGDHTKLAYTIQNVSFEIVNHWSQRGLLYSLDQDLQELLVVKPQSLVLPLPELRERMNRLQSTFNIPKDYLQGWEKEMKWDKAKLLKALKQENSEKLWRKWITTKFSSQPLGSAGFVPLGCPPCAVVGGILLGLAVIAMVIDCADTQCDGSMDIFNPPQPPPPTPPSGAGCFVRGTLVATAQGPKPIEGIYPGDVIYTFDLRKGAPTVHTVVETFKVQRKEILVLDFGDEEIRCTPLHRFYTEQWVPAKELKRGDRILSIEGHWKALKGIKREIKNQPVFNLHVDKDHNYFIGQSALLVHNSKTP